MSEKIIIDPEIKSLIPPLDKGELEQLEANLRTDGCRDKLTGWKGHSILLDGHNRQGICERLGIGYQIEWKEFASRAAAIVWVIQNQFGRRNLNDFQRAELALKLKAAIAEDAELRQKSGAKNEGGGVGANLPQGRTAEKLGEIAGVSATNVKKAERIQRDAEPEIAAMARKGDVSIDAAAKVATLPKAAQKAVAAAGPKAVKDKAKEIREGKTEAEAEPDVLDECGKPVDGKLRQVFTDAQRFDEAGKLLNQISRVLSPLLDRDEKRLEAGLWIESPLVEKSLKDLRFAIKSARPHAPCVYPNCNAKCPACQGKKWLPTVRWNETPESYKKKAGRGEK